MIAMTTCDASLAPLMAASSTESNFLKWSLPTLCNSQTCSYIVIFWILSFVTSTSSTSGYINLLKQRAAGAVITQDVTRWAGLAPKEMYAARTVPGVRQITKKRVYLEQLYLILTQILTS
jgi:hypothetical protein